MMTTHVANRSKHVVMCERQPRVLATFGGLHPSFSLSQRIEVLKIICRQVVLDLCDGFPRFRSREVVCGIADFATGLEFPPGTVRGVVAYALGVLRQNGAKPDGCSRLFDSIVPYHKLVTGRVFRACPRIEWYHAARDRLLTCPTGAMTALPATEPGAAQAAERRTHRRGARPSPDRVPPAVGGWRKSQTYS